MICLKCCINQISIVHLFYGFLPPKVSVGFLLSVSILDKFEVSLLDISSAVKPFGHFVVRMKQSHKGRIDEYQ